jgi:hypothetical protein
MYLYPFKNDYRDHDLAMIYDIIKDHYPVEGKKRYTHKTISTSPAFEKVNRLVNEEFLNPKAYKAKWEKFASVLKKELKRPVYSYPELGHSPCFHGEVMLKEIKETDFIRGKTLHFNISVIGPFFSIQGIDSSNAILPIDPRPHIQPETGNFVATHASTVSPIFEYKEMFNRLEELIRQHFPIYRFIPYSVGMSTIKNISIKDDLSDFRILDTVYEGLFGRGAVNDCLTRGDTNYGLDDWLKPLNKRETKLIDLIAEHVSTASSDITIHKVWKLQESKRLETLVITGNLMFGMDLFDVIDLCDQSTVITIAEKARGTPSKAKYKIANNIIELNELISLRIVELTQDKLTLNVIINLAHNKVSAKGEAVQMKFIQMKKTDSPNRSSKN